MAFNTPTGVLNRSSYCTYSMILLEVASQSKELAHTSSSRRSSPTLTDRTIESSRNKEKAVTFARETNRGLEWLLELVSSLS